jgi:predicted RNase H-like HicB family nuclease
MAGVWVLDLAVLVHGRLTSCNAVRVTQVVHIPYVVEQDEDGAWCASALLRPGVGAVGDGATPEEAITDLRGALEALLEVVGPPSELTLTVNIA